MRTLLVDDDPFALSLMSEQLGQLGLLDVRSCEHALDALQHLETNPSAIDLVLCDLQMPELDGVEFVRHLARIDYRGALLLVSGEDLRILQTAERLARAHSLRVLGSLLKPVRLASLRQLLHGQSAPVPAVRAAVPEYSAERLHHAIVADELVLHYQPKVTLSDGALHSVEALVRWQHPEDGLVAPDRFVPLAEAAGLIGLLTQRVLAMALQQCRQWQDAGLRLQVAVNVAMDDLVSLQFPDVVSEQLQRAGVAAELLLLEVTESQLMSDPRAALDILTRLRLKRIALAIDDFGTGHSSLKQLHDLPFDQLKIDRGFVSGAHSNPTLRAIVDGSLGMAHQLGMLTVAEGVESVDDLEFLRERGCDFAQGYFISRPLPGAAIAAWAEAWCRRDESPTAAEGASIEI